jgi:hypothetical protein
VCGGRGAALVDECSSDTDEEILNQKRATSVCRIVILQNQGALQVLIDLGISKYFKHGDNTKINKTVYYLIPYDVYER